MEMCLQRTRKKEKSSLEIILRGEHHPGPLPDSNACNSVVMSHYIYVCVIVHM